MAKDFSAMEDSNSSANPSIHDVTAAMGRRSLLQGAGLASLVALLQPLSGCASVGAKSIAGMSFQAIPPGKTDALVVPPGYVAQVLAAWATPSACLATCRPFVLTPATAPVNRLRNWACTMTAWSSLLFAAAPATG